MLEKQKLNFFGLQPHPTFKHKNSKVIQEVYDAANVELELLKDLGDYNQIYDEMWTEVLTN